MTIALLTSILQIAAIVCGFVSAYFWWKSSTVKFGAEQNFVFIGGSAAITEDALEKFNSVVTTNSKKAALLSGLTMAFQASVFSMELVFGLDAM